MDNIYALHVSGVVTRDYVSVDRAIEAFKTDDRRREGLIVELDEYGDRTGRQWIMNWNFSIRPTRG